MIHNLYNDSFEYCLNKPFMGLPQINQLQMSAFESSRNNDEAQLGKRAAPQLDPAIAEVLRNGNGSKRVKESLAVDKRRSYFSDDSDEQEESVSEKERVGPGTDPEEQQQP